MPNLNNYIIINVVQVRQLQNGLVFTGKIKFGELNQIFKLTERQESVHDPIDNTTITLSAEDQQFQRQLSFKKLREIQIYLQEEMKQLQNGKSLGMFPSSLILYNRSYESDDLNLDDTKYDLNDNEDVILTEDIIQNSYHANLDCCFYLTNQSPDIYKLYIPKNPKITLIVDGQHRFFGTKQFYNTLSTVQKLLVDDFEFIVTYLVGFDVYEVGQIFATVNFNQKPVNRSLYYDIFGSAPQTDREGNLQNDIRLAHDLVLHLNNSESSPIKSMVKLLGKGYGLFSQAFFVEKIIRVFRTGIWDSYLIDYVNQGDHYKDIAIFMKDFFSAIQEAYPSAWPEKINRGEKMVYSSYSYPYILWKTTGLGAFFRLIKNIYPRVSSDPSNYKINILSILNRINDSEANALFSKEGNFGGSGSEGIQDKLYKQLLIAYDLN